MSDTEDDPQMLENLEMLMNFEMLADESTSVEDLEKMDKADGPSETGVKPKNGGA